MKAKKFLLPILIPIFFIALSQIALADTVILPHRVIDARTLTVIDFEGLLARCSDARVVTFGEQHDDPATHMMELAILEGLYRYHPDIVLSMEMFELDVQEILNNYLAGDISEEEFLENSRPWGNYETDYRPMIIFAFENGLPVVAANIPRPLASRVSQEGLSPDIFEEDELPPPGVVFEAPDDDYWDKFFETMSMMSDSHGDGMEMDEEMIRNFYRSQVYKDEVMAASVSNAANENPDAIVYHVAGGFHLGDYLGTFPRIKRNLPGVDAVSIMTYPVDNILEIPEDLEAADYWILVQAPEEEEIPDIEMPPGDEDKSDEVMPPLEEDEPEADMPPPAM